jgi:transposase InsO family protein
MRINGIKPVRTRKHKVTTNSNHILGIAPNLLDGDFATDLPNRKWADDISYISTQEGWLYLAVILDLHSRRVVGWPFDALRSQRPDEAGSGDPGTRDGRKPAESAEGLHRP